ncbi:MAG: hypothetical protein CMP18_02120 [Rickettsiales bacterium]|nr:hypothetical protein [Rickettsiales bacterium]|tara:strand:+ start:2466 stop:4658 length:2193 start_codon:yes stop_codon:yes gene_type:complete
MPADTKKSEKKADDADDAFSFKGSPPGTKPISKLNTVLSEFISSEEAEALFPGLVIPLKDEDEDENEKKIEVKYTNDGHKSITSYLEEPKCQKAIQDFATKHPDTTTLALIKITGAPKFFEMDEEVQSLIDEIKTHYLKRKKGISHAISTYEKESKFLNYYSEFSKKRKDLNNQSNNLEGLIDLIDKYNPDRDKFDPSFLITLKDKIESIKENNLTEEQSIKDDEFLVNINEKLKQQKKELYTITSHNKGCIATTFLTRNQFNKIQEDNVANSTSWQDSLLEFIANKYKITTTTPQGITPAQQSFYHSFFAATSSITNPSDQKYSKQAEELKKIKDSYNELISSQGDSDKIFLKNLFGDNCDEFDELMKGDYSAYIKEQKGFKQALETSLKKIDFSSNYEYEKGTIENDDTALCFNFFSKTHGSASISTEDYQETRNSIHTQLQEFEKYLKDKKNNNNTSNKWSKPSYYKEKINIKKLEKLIKSLKTALNSDNDDDNKSKITAIEDIISDKYFKKLKSEHSTLNLQKDLELLKDYHSNKKDGKTSAATLILDTRRDKENLSIGEGLFTICNKKGSNDFQLIINKNLLKGDQQEDHDNVFFKNIGRDKDGKNYYIRMFVAKGGETIYKDGEPNEKATKDDIVFDKNTIWCAKSESQLHKGEAIKIDAKKAPKNIRVKFKETHIIVLEANNNKIIESEIFTGGLHSKIITPSTSPQPQSATAILPQQQHSLA